MISDITPQPNGMNVLQVIHMLYIVWEDRALYCPVSCITVHTVPLCVKLGKYSTL